MKFRILTEDSIPVHFDLDEDGCHEISTKDLQSHEGMVYFLCQNRINIYISNIIEHLLNVLLFSVYQSLEITFYCTFMKC